MKDFTMFFLNKQLDIANKAHDSCLGANENKVLTLAHQESLTALARHSRSSVTKGPKGLGNFLSSPGRKTIDNNIWLVPPLLSTLAAEAECSARLEKMI